MDQEGIFHTIFLFYPTTFGRNFQAHLQTYEEEEYHIRVRLTCSDETLQATRLAGMYEGE